MSVPGGKEATEGLTYEITAADTIGRGGPPWPPAGKPRPRLIQHRTLVRE